MPLVDVTDLLIDPDIAGQSFVVLRRQETVNNFGESTHTIARIPAIGSVQPSGDQSLIREEGFDAQANTIKVVTTFRLRGVTKGPNIARWKPDIVLWGGNYFEVISPNDWDTFGAGFIEVECTSIHYVDVPPMNALPNVARLDFSRASNSGLAHGAGGIG